MTITRAFKMPALEDKDLTISVLPAATVTAATRKSFVNVGKYKTVDTWVISSGDNAAPVIVQITTRYDPDNDYTHNTMRVAADVKSSSDLTDEIDYATQDATIGWGYPGHACVDSNYVVQQVSVVFGLFAKTLTGANGYPTTAVVDAVDIGATQTVMA